MLPMKKILTACALLCLFGGTVFSQEEIEYKKFKLEDSSCDVGVRYKNTPKGMIIGVGAIATGRGVEFRKWSVSSIKLNIGGKRFKPDKEEKFYVTEESFWRIPGAIVFAAIGILGDYSNNDFENAIGKAGVGLGLGLIALQASGEIGGVRCIFNIPPEAVSAIKEGQDAIEINIENEGLHLKDTIKIGLIMPKDEMLERYNYDKMSQEGLLGLVDSLKGQIAALEDEQTVYKYGRDPRYDDIQRKIEGLETERGMAYKAWFERKHKK